MNKGKPTATPVLNNSGTGKAFLIATLLQLRRIDLAQIRFSSNDFVTRATHQLFTTEKLTRNLFSCAYSRPLSVAHKICLQTEVRLTPRDHGSKHFERLERYSYQPMQDLKVTNVLNRVRAHQCLINYPYEHLVGKKFTRCDFYRP